jgi:CheY-like chemotaxis protein
MIMANHASADRDCDSITAGLNVLIAEDDPIAAESLACILERAGHTTRVVYDGQAALAAALIDPPDVAILDIDLPRMDGWAVARRIRAGFGGRPCLLIAITGRCDPDDGMISRRAGMERHLTKPLATDSLVAMLERYQNMSGE